MKTRRPRGKCGRPVYPTHTAAQQAASRGNRQCDNPHISCIPFQCPHGEHHVILYPRGERLRTCPCGLPHPTLTGLLTIHDYLTTKHPSDTNPYVLIRCPHNGAHTLRANQVPTGAVRLALPPLEQSRAG